MRLLSKTPIVSVLIRSFCRLVSVAGFILTTTISASTGVAAGEPVSLSIMMAEIPPLVMKIDGKPKGVLNDLGLELIKRTTPSPFLKFDQNPEVFPWARAYRNLKAGPGKIMLQMVRLPEREDLFSWGWPLMNLEFSFATIKEPAVDSIEQALTHKLVGVYQNSRLELYLRKNGFGDTNLLPVMSSKQNFNLLRYGRIDSWFSLRDEARWLASTAEPAEQLIIGAPILQSKIWMVASKDVPGSVLSILNQAMVEILSDGTYQNIRRKYGLAPQK